MKQLNPPESAQSDQMLSDEQAWDRIRQGDERAFSEMFHRYYAPMCRFVVSFVHSQEIAKEIVQEIFYRVWKNRAEANIQGSLKAYLFGAARNHAINFLRKDRNSRYLIESATAEYRVPGLARSFDAPDDSLLHRELIQAFENALQSLPEGQRTVVILRWHHHMSHADISHTLGISIKGVETQMGRAIKRMRRALETFR
jgi:RNA polymerase sigma-70 factor (ECF subfamily)